MLKREDELELLAKILIFLSFVLSIFAFFVGIYFTVFVRKYPFDLNSFLFWNAMCVCGVLFSVWAGRSRWGWFRRKPK